MTPPRCGCSMHLQGVPRDPRRSYRGLPMPVARMRLGGCLCLTIQVSTITCVHEAFSTRSPLAGAQLLPIAHGGERRPRGASVLGAWVHESKRAAARRCRCTRVTMPQRPLSAGDPSRTAYHTDPTHTAWVALRWHSIVGTD